MAATIDEITIRYSEEGIDIIQEIDKQVLSKGAWTTIIFKYRDWDRAKQTYGPERYSIRRYQKRSGEYIPKSKFNISSRTQAEKIVEVLQSWLTAGDDGNKE